MKKNERNHNMQPLYDAVDAMYQYGVAIHNDSVQKLAKQLKQDLNAFLQDTKRHAKALRKPFLDDFLKKLHEQDASFSSDPESASIKHHLHTAHKLVYIALFPPTLVGHSFGLFKKRETDVSGEAVLKAKSSGSAP